MKATLLFLLAVAAAAQDRNSSIIGIVSDSVSHQPLRRVMVTLGFPSSTEPPPPIEQQRVNTDDAGAFAFHNLKPGEYRVAVERSDYPAWKEVTASPSEDPDPLHIELVPGAIVSGRILDEDGDPLTGCGVRRGWIELQRISQRWRRIGTSRKRPGLKGRDRTPRRQYVFSGPEPEQTVFACLRIAARDD